ncbi:ABC transporter substrate-binding protein [Gammaproteobacteria bacterium]|jgi:phospholipid transport system substrate-binding protein|nr:ABC transporter substrate-binding protein [Gammaproteobacteria bacterium]|tara:strand:+ start:99 stop:713 length:615 start_codon:yes stop_codon:yes gene_type:complete
MNNTLKSLAFFLGIVCLHSNPVSASDPHKFIDTKAQEMVAIIRNNQELFAKDPELFKDKINIIFEPMVDFRRVGASVMGKKYYLASSKEQRLQFIESFRTSLLDTYSSTLAQWGDQKIMTIFPELTEFQKTEDVKQNLITSSNTYPITYKVRRDKNGNWLIINIIVNGVNLGLTFRNQFQALAKEHNENIDEVIKHWTSDANLD